MDRRHFLKTSLLSMTGKPLVAQMARPLLTDVANESPL